MRRNEFEKKMDCHGNTGGRNTGGSLETAGGRFFQLLCLVADGGNTGAFDAAADGPSVCGIRGSGLDVLKDFGLFDSRVSHLGSCGGRGSAFYRRRLCGRDSILGGFDVDFEFPGRKRADIRISGRTVESGLLGGDPFPVFLPDVDLSGRFSSGSLRYGEVYGLWVHGGDDAKHNASGPGSLVFPGKYKLLLRRAVLRGLSDETDRHTGGGDL